MLFSVAYLTREVTLESLRELAETLFCCVCGPSPATLSPFQKTGMFEQAVFPSPCSVNMLFISDLLHYEIVK